jgi:hypothetical protein
MNEKMVSFIKRYHRWILWIILGLLNLLDIITTFIGVQQGGRELSPILKNYVDNPVLFIGYKIVIFFFFVFSIEFAILLRNKLPYDENFSTMEKRIYYFVYNAIYVTCIFLIICFIGFYLVVQINNLEFIFKHPSS